MSRWILIVPCVLAAGLAFLLFTPERTAMKRSPTLAQLVDFDAFPPLPDQPMSFPRDHGNHLDVPMEAWQVQGILTTPKGRRLGFQLHIFALGLRPGSPDRPSAWGAHRYFLAYFTRTDPKTQTFQIEHREERATLGLSGADDQRLWVDDWMLEFSQDRLLLRAGQRGDYLELSLKLSQPPSSPGENPPNLRVYRLHRLTARGLWGTEPVTGSAWLEHAWGILPLPGGPVSLQRFQVQLKDGRNLLCFELRHRDDSNARGPSRCLVSDSASPPKRLDARITAVSSWRSRSNQIYPIAWRLESPTLNLDLEAVIPNQVVAGPIALWSGWVRAHNREGEQGEGFVQVFGQPMEER